MNRDFLIGLVAYIVDTLRHETGTSPFLTKVVKLIYLIDVEYYRAFGCTLSGLSWRFHHYGPWDDALRIALQGRLQGIAPTEVITPKGKGTTWQVTDPPPADELFGRSADQAVVDRVLSKWGNMEIELILEHVYEDTEPMHGARFGEPLDFSKINRDLWPDRSPRYLGADPAVVERIRKHVRSRKQKAPTTDYLLDPDYQKALPVLCEERAVAYPARLKVRVPNEVVKATSNPME